MIFSIKNIFAINSLSEIMCINNNSENNILLIGSCRVYAFLNYMVNDKLFGKKYNYLCILVYNPSIVKLSREIIHNEQIKSQIVKSTILVAEYVCNYNYFNTDRCLEQNIFKINDSFTHTIILPNWPDSCIYTKDICKFKKKDVFEQFIKKEISLEDFMLVLRTTRDEEINNFFLVIYKANEAWKSLIPFIKSSLIHTRLSYSINHLSNSILFEMYKLMIVHYFSGTISDSLIDFNNNNVFFDNKVFFHPDCYTKLTYYDHLCFGCTINEHYLDENESNHYILNG